MDLDEFAKKAAAAQDDAYEKFKSGERRRRHLVPPWMVERLKRDIRAEARREALRDAIDRLRGLDLTHVHGREQARAVAVHAVLVLMLKREGELRATIDGLRDENQRLTDALLAKEEPDAT